MSSPRLDKKRPSPALSATLFAVGAKRVGNDGRKWQVVANSQGVKRWVATPSTRKRPASQRAAKVSTRRLPAYAQRGLAWIAANQRAFRALIDNEAGAQGKSLDRAGLAAQLIAVVEGWQALTGRNQDLSPQRIGTLSRNELSQQLAWYTSDEGQGKLLPFVGELLLLACKELQRRR